VNLREWAHRWGISFDAVAELEILLGLDGTAGIVDNGKSEAWAQSAERLAAARAGVLLFRNNVGVLPDENGRPVRYGLANESKQQNERLKSSDLIGIDPTIITPADVGQPRGRFVAREMKSPGWQYSGTPREVAQLAFITLISTKGGDARFSTGADV
jgi:hypothetical protein